MLFWHFWDFSLLIWSFWLYLLTHTSIKMTISTLYLQSEVIKILCLHSFVPKQLLNLCVFRLCSYFSSLLCSNRSFTVLTISWKKKAAATLATFHESPFYLAFLGRSIYSKCLTKYSKCPVPVWNTADLLTWMALKGLGLIGKLIEEDWVLLWGYRIYPYDAESSCSGMTVWFCTLCSMAREGGLQHAGLSRTSPGLGSPIQNSDLAGVCWIYC